MMMCVFLFLIVQIIYILHTERFFKDFLKDVSYAYQSCKKSKSRNIVNIITLLIDFILSEKLYILYSIF